MDIDPTTKLLKITCNDGVVFEANRKWMIDEFKTIRSALIDESAGVDNNENDIPLNFDSKLIALLLKKVEISNTITDEKEKKKQLDEVDRAYWYRQGEVGPDGKVTKERNLTKLMKAQSFLGANTLYMQTMVYVGKFILNNDLPQIFDEFRPEGITTMPSQEEMLEKFKPYEPMLLQVCKPLC